MVFLSFCKVFILCFFVKCGVKGRNVLISAKLIARLIEMLYVSH